jgi:hypothetical protein
MTMNRIFTLAASALLGTAFAHTAFAQNLRTVDDSNGIEVVGRDAGQNIVGGATYRVIGAGEGAVIEVIQAPVTQQGRVARVVGSGENASVVTAPAVRG